MKCDRCDKELDSNKFFINRRVVCFSCYKIVSGKIKKFKDTQPRCLEYSETKLPNWLDPNKKGDVILK